MADGEQDAKLRHTALDRYSWDSLRLLLCLDEAGSFRSAAAIGGVSLNTIRTKIDRLEHQFGGPLIVRSVEGTRMNQDGAELVSIAREMRHLGQTASRLDVASRSRPTGIVRVTVTEGLGTYWLVPQIADFADAHSNLRVQLTCSMKAPDVQFRDVDVSIQLVRPTNRELEVRRIGTLHVMPFASEPYLRRFGVPTSLSEADRHRIVWQNSEQLPVEMLGMFMPPEVADRAIVLQTDTSSAQFHAVAKGAGIGLLPTYARGLTASVRPLDVGLELHHEIFLAWHRSATDEHDIRATVDWLTAAFDPAVHPWFADEFIHPRAFEDRRGAGVVVNLFDEFETI